jgi:hypothetical protein
MFAVFYLFAVWSGGTVLTGGLSRLQVFQTSLPPDSFKRVQFYHRSVQAMVSDIISIGRRGLGVGAAKEKKV